MGGAGVGTHGLPMVDELAMLRIIEFKYIFVKLTLRCAVSIIRGNTMSLTQKEIDALKKKLEATLRDLNKEIVEDEKPVEFGSDVESTDDAPEEADEAEELSGNAGIAATIRERRDAVEAALRKIAAGKYGACERCTRLIDHEVLAVDPESRLCHGCKTKK